MKRIIAILISLLPLLAFGDTYRNPVINADVPDVSIVKVQDTYYMISTTMHLMPGGPIMKSKDMVNWETISYVFDRINDGDRYDLIGGQTVYGQGQWASSIRYHMGKFWVWFTANGAPGKGFVFSADKAEGPWTLVARPPHMHDASLFFDEDGKRYLFTGSGSCTVVELDDNFNPKEGGLNKRVVNGADDPQERGALLEGSSVIKHNGYYYICMISMKWGTKGRVRREVCYRSRSIDGPYEKKIILETPFESYGGVGQGCLVGDDNSDKGWMALIFQDRGGIGRVPVTMPVTWVDGWPMCGEYTGKINTEINDIPEDNPTGNPRLDRRCYRIPNDTRKSHPSLIGGIVGNDEFDAAKLKLYWQWNHNPIDNAWSLTERPGYLRLKTARVVDNINVAPNTISQRMVAPECCGRVCLDVAGMKDGDICGLAAFNGDSGVLRVVKRGGKYVLQLTEEKSVFAQPRNIERVDVTLLREVPLAFKASKRIWLQLHGDFNPDRDIATFAYSLNGTDWVQFPDEIKMVYDYRRHFMGSRFAIFNYATKTLGGHVDVDWFRLDDNGTRLWLRAEGSGNVNVISKAGDSPVIEVAADELRHHFSGTKVTLQLSKSMPDDDGYSISVSGTTATITAHREAGLLYGAYALLRNQQLGRNKSVTDHPLIPLRILNHWDNLDGSIERGYAGRSIFWGLGDGGDELQSADVIRDYARANASVGINGTVLNNVNASPLMLAKSNLLKVKHYADILRPYGIRVYLSVNFASPMGLGTLPTADPLDASVKQWWKDKVDEIYSLIPDFGGFLVKANSEGQPGPGDFNRSHSEGANMLADVLAPHDGIVMWRAFVYGYHGGEDRVKKAVAEFQPLDGQFARNVILQIKNGPLDFQPREPYSPLFDCMPKTPLMPELQITQEYLGQSRHLVYLGTMWEEFFRFVSPKTIVGVAGVANIGDDANWCGHHFSQANWYAFGRMAWNPALSSRSIADEWLRLTFTSDKRFLQPMTDVMMASREACVNYMMPLGLHHIFADDHHYGPNPSGDNPTFPDEWKPVWYHKAAADGIGFDRSATGTDAVSQYREPYRSLYNDVKTCPEEYILWFHHLPWDYKMHDGSTLWQSLCRHYDEGVASVDGFAETWKQMRPYVDERRYEEVLARLQHQQANAREWRKTCIDYFGTFVKNK